MYRRRLTLLTALLALGLSTPALAQEDGVTFDRDDGPARKEYGIPLDDARGDAGAGRGSSGAGGAGGGAGLPGLPADGVLNEQRQAEAVAKRTAAERMAALQGDDSLFGAGVAPGRPDRSEPLVAAVAGASPALWTLAAALAALIGGAVAWLVRRRGAGRPALPDLRRILGRA